jgi:peptidyl-prolyl cis-trans isomerase A (cyclophilin A)
MADHSQPNEIPLPDPDRVQRTVNATIERFQQRKRFYIGLSIVVLLAVAAAIFFANLPESKEASTFAALWRRCEAVRAKQTIDVSAKAELAELEAYLDEVKGTPEEGLCLWFLAIYNYAEASTGDKALFEERKPYLEKAMSYIEPLYEEARFGDLFLAKPHWYTASSASPIDQLHAQIKADLAYEAANAKSQPKPDDDLVAVLRTSEGDVYLHFYRGLAPDHTKNFVTLATSGTYNETAFHYIGGGTEEPVSVHAGDPYTFFYNDPLNKDHILRWGKGGVGYDIPPEESRFKIVHREGIVTSLKRDRADWDNGAQFQIMLEADPGLDRRHTPFAQVVEGMKVVRAAAKRKTASQHPPYKDDYRFSGADTRDLVVEPVILHKVIVYENGKALEHAFPLTEGEKSLSTLAQAPVTPLTGDDLFAGGRQLRKPSTDPALIHRGTDVPYPEDVDVKEASPKGARGGAPATDQPDEERPGDERPGGDGG